MAETHRELRHAYGESLSHLDDLRRLGGPSLAPIAGQIQFHLARMLEVAEEQTPLPSMNPILYSLAREKFEQILCDSFNVQHGVHSLAQYFHPAISFELLENGLSDLPNIITLAQKFKPKAVRFSMDLSGIEISLAVSSNENLASLRPLAYKLTQIFLAKNSVLTYEIAEREGQAFIDLNLRYANQLSKNLAYQVGELEFDPILSIYESSETKVREVGAHHIISIDENAKVSLTQSLPEQDTFEKTFIHLPFLFRPLSIIISGRGNLTATRANSTRVSLFELFR